jgi:hypothetical protein
MAVAAMTSLWITGLAVDDREPVSPLTDRLWSAQHPSGGLGHFVEIHAGKPVSISRESTGEATAIAILATTVSVAHSPPRDTGP